MQKQIARIKYKNYLFKKSAYNVKLIFLLHISGFPCSKDDCDSLFTNPVLNKPLV